MANLKEVRNRIASVSSTQQITNAMKMVSAAKLKRATNAIVDLRPYANKLKEILSNLSASVEGNASPYLENRNPEKVLLVVITSNRGLAVAFNANVIKATNLLISQKYAEQRKKGNVSILAIGKRGQDHFSRHNYPMIGNHTELFSQLNFENTSVITDLIMKGFVEGEYDRVEIVYNQFKNAAVQYLATEQLLPLDAIEKNDSQPSPDSDYTFDLSREEITK